MCKPETYIWIELRPWNETTNPSNFLRFLVALLLISPWRYRVYLWVAKADLQQYFRLQSDHQLLSYFCTKHNLKQKETTSDSALEGGINACLTILNTV